VYSNLVRSTKPSTWLADAGLNFLQARIYCLSGAEEDGVKLYDKIIRGRRAGAAEERIGETMTLAELMATFAV
jgi:hypothetical protein